MEVHESDGFFQVWISPEPGFIKDPEADVMIDEVFHLLEEQYFSVERIGRVLKFVKLTIKSSAYDATLSLRNIGQVTLGQDSYFGTFYDHC